MGYNNVALKPMSAGSGRAPGIFTYHTPDTIANITTEGYFPHGLFEPNDIIYATPLETGFSKVICVEAGVDVDGNSVVDFSTIASFAGDVRETDEAGYQSENFGVGNGSAQGVFMHYTYRNNTDTKALILGADYFLEAGLFLEIGDIIECVSVDGAFMARVLTTGTAGVTIEEIVFA